MERNPFWPNLSKFLHHVEIMQQIHDARTGRVYGKDSFGHFVRRGSRYLTYAFWRLGITAPAVLYAHGLFDLCAIICVWYGEPLLALACWLVAHVLDNCDGDLARVRDEVDEKWDKVDRYQHMVVHVLFWLTLGLQNDQLLWSGIILGALCILTFFRYSAGKREFGEKSRKWSLITLPLNVNIVYVAWVAFVLLGYGWAFVPMYAGYIVTAAGGRSLLFYAKDLR